MKLVKVAAGLMTAVMTAGVMSSGLADISLWNKQAAIKAEEKEPENAKLYTMDYGHVAPFTTVGLITALGTDITIGVTDNTFTYSCAGSTYASVEITETSTGYPTIAEATGTTSLSVDLNGLCTDGAIYDVFLDWTCDGISQHNEEIYLTCANGTVSFACSGVYDIAMERLAELQTTPEYLEECLQSQNDIECDNPEVIRIANEITEGCTDDWEKSLAIYRFLTEECAYDYIQTEDDYYAYQDDALSLLRRRIMICEGFGNCFTALCRAVGIPACETFGCGETARGLFTEGNLVSDEDEGCNHAWAMVCLGGRWWSVDPTWDCDNAYEGNSHDTGTITWGESTLSWYLIPAEIFSNTHIIYDADTTHGIVSSGDCGTTHYEISQDGTITLSGSGEVTLPEALYGFRRVVFAEGSNFTSIGDRAFLDRDAIETIILPDTITSIGDKAFCTCEDLEYIYIPDGVTSIGSSAFDYCDELAYVYIPDSVTSIGNWAFDDCPRAIISVPASIDNLDSNYYVSPARVIYR